MSEYESACVRRREGEGERGRADSADGGTMSLADGRLRHAIIHEARDPNKANSQLGPKWS